jgi:hypothetical protein
MVAKKSRRGGARKGAGRKPLGAAARDERVVVLLTAAELKRLKALAKRAGVLPGGFAHQLLSRDLRRAK